jgi:surface protein
VTFPSPGQYRVDYSGNFTTIVFIEWFNPENINRTLFRSVEQWGDSAWTNLSAAFQNVTNLTFNASDVPDLSQTTVTSVMFWDATNFNSDISNWDMSNVTDAWGMFMGATSFNQDISSWDMSSNQRFWRMFQGASSFNQPLDNWDVSEALYMEDMFTDSAISEENYSNILISWAALPSLQNNVTLGAQFINHAETATVARQFLIDTYNWTINDAGLYREPGNETFITRWDTTLDSNTSHELQIYIGGGSSYNFFIDWGDGTVQRYPASPNDYISHTYSTPGIKTVTITGTFPYFYAGCYDGDASNKLIDVAQWGTGQWESFANAFGGCTYLEAFSAADTPNLSQVEDMSYMFDGATAFDYNLSRWDVSSVVNMNATFAGATAFNGDITGWDVSNVTNMSSMFENASSFNGNIGDWDVSSVTNMSYMFGQATAFNQDLSAWDISNATFDWIGFDGTSLSTSNYTKILEAWSLLTVQPDLSFGEIGPAGNLTPYCGSAQSARDILANVYNWGDWTDGGPVPCKTATYTLSGVGEITGDDFQYIVDGEGGTAVTVVPADGYRFVSWSDGSTANPRTDSNLVSNISVTAILEAAESSPGSNSTAIGVRAERLSEMIANTPIVASITTFVSAVRDFLAYLSANEDEIEKMTAEERAKVITTLRDIIAFLLRFVPGA